MSDSGRTLSVYAAADWGARLAGTAIVRRGTDGAIYVDDILVTDVKVSGQFSILQASDGRSHVVLSSFLRLVPTVS